MVIENFRWTREPENYSIHPNRVEITTMPHTDLWQRTYYHFRNDNAPVLQMETEDKYFSRICGHQPRLFRLGDNSYPCGRKSNVVPVQPPGG